MRDTSISWKKARTENLTCIGPGKVSGFRDRMKDLGESIAMYWQIVDGFVGSRFTTSFVIRSSREHAENSAGVRVCQRFSLRCRFSRVRESYLNGLNVDEEER